MARVVYTPVALETTAVATSDAIFTAISGQSAAVDEENVGEEGLDKRVLESNVQSTRAFDLIQNTAAGTQALTTTFAVFDTSTGAALKSGAITVESDEILVVKAYVDLLSDGTQEGIPDGGDVEYKLQYLPNGGADTDFASSFRVRLPPGYKDGTANASGNGRLATMFKLDGAATLDYVQLVIRDASGNDVTIQAKSALLIGRIYKRH